jgi:hypothetical protein
MSTPPFFGNLKHKIAIQKYRKKKAFALTVIMMYAAVK